MRWKGKIPNGKSEENFDVTQITKKLLDTLNCGMKNAELLMSNNEHQILNQSTLRYDVQASNGRINLRLVNSDFF